MPALAPALEGLSLDITQEIHVRSSLEATFKALLEEMGPANQGHNDTPMPMTLEARPGGRWFRDLGDGNGHLWATSRRSRADPARASRPADDVVRGRQQRPVPAHPERRRHPDHAAPTALGLFPDGYREELSKGFPMILNRVKQRLESAGPAN